MTKQRRPRSLVSIYQDQQSGMWYLRYAISVGLPRRSLNTRDMKVAEAIRLNEEHKIVFSQHDLGDKPVRRIQFSEFATLFLRYKAGQGKAHNTLESYTYALNNFGNFLQTDAFLHTITLDTLEGYAAHRRSVRRRKKKSQPEDPGKPIAEKTIRNEMITLVTAFKWAERQRFIQESPAAHLELPKKVKYPPRYLTKQDYLRLKGKIDDEEFRDVVDFYLLTGIRRGEGPVLRVSEHVDMESGILKLPQAKQSDYRAIPISDQLRPVLKRLILRASPGDRFIRFTDDTLTNRFRKYAGAAGLPKGMTFHALRHTFGTWLASVGVRFSLIQEVMGQRDPESTKIYVHAFNEDIARAFAKLELPTN